MPRIWVTPTATIKSIDLKNIQRRLLDSKMKTTSLEAFCGSWVASLIDFQTNIETDQAFVFSFLLSGALAQ